ncbi:MAG: polysaccharide biosynthesis protein, partial [Flavobacteriales bacterium]|nr:polysaccharide biosynthesis protein [Flavobacteriales bacterium]
METALFNFCQKQGNKQLVFSTGMRSIAFTTAIFWLFTFSFSDTLAELIRYTTHREYVYWLGLIIGLDALT